MQRHKRLATAGSGLIATGLVLLLLSAAVGIYLSLAATDAPSPAAASVAAPALAPPATSPAAVPVTRDTGAPASPAPDAEAARPAEAASVEPPVLIQPTFAASPSGPAIAPAPASGAAVPTAAAPPARIQIPSLKIDRSIVPVQEITTDDWVDWDTDKLFATADRPDLVGHLQGSADPGERGNMILVGHNSNGLPLKWKGVFYSLWQLKKGNVIHIWNASGVRTTYEVQRLDWVRWPPQTEAETFAHMAHLLPTHDEILTLSTCGGNSTPLEIRLYVTASPALQ